MALGLPTQINVSVYIQNLGDVSETNAVIFPIRCRLLNIFIESKAMY